MKIFLQAPQVLFEDPGTKDLKQPSILSTRLANEYAVVKKIVQTKLVEGPAAEFLKVKKMFYHSANGEIAKCSCTHCDCIIWFLVWSEILFRVV